MKKTSFNFQVSENGNYCKNDNIKADDGFLKVIRETKLFRGKRVASMGEGTGNLY